MYLRDVQLTDLPAEMPKLVVLGLALLVGLAPVAPSTGDSIAEVIR